MTESYIKFKRKSEIQHACNTLLANEHRLDETLKEISTLVRGQVKPHDTIRRSHMAAYVSSLVQQIGNSVYKNRLKLSQDLLNKLHRIGSKADKVLRENIVLQTTGPLDVIPFENVPVRHSYSSFGGREQRWGYGFHKKPFNEEGSSVTVANMPPHYTQSIHNHTLSEYCLVLDSRTEGIYYPGGKREKIYSTKKHELLRFSATTPHTLRNPSDKFTRNITFKQAIGLMDWKPVGSLNKVRIIRARLIKGKLTKLKQGHTMKRFYIDDKYYNYTIEIIKLKAESTYTAIHDYDQYMFVINGKLTITAGKIKKECGKNDYIVIDKNTQFTIEARTTCRLYTVRS